MENEEAVVESGKGASRTEREGYHGTSHLHRGVTCWQSGRRVLFLLFFQLGVLTSSGSTYCILFQAIGAPLKTKMVMFVGIWALTSVTVVSRVDSEL